MSPKPHKVHWRKAGSVYKPACRPDLRVPEPRTTPNVDRVTCKTCKRELGVP